MLRKLVLPAALVASVAAAATYQTDWPGASAPVNSASPEPVPLEAAPRTVVSDPAIGIAVSEWNRLRQSDSLPFSDYAAFLIAHPGWPGEAAMRRAAERAIRVDMEQPAQVIGLFQRTPPQTLVGYARYADALMALGRADEARAAARKAWTGGTLPPEEEARLQSRFGAAFSQEDQDKRMERLLWNRSTSAAARQIAYVSDRRRPIYAARLAMQMRDPMAGTLADALRPAADRDPGFALDRALWLRDTARSPEARAYLAAQGNYDGLPFDAEKWMEGLLSVARAAGADGQWSLAYNIASHLDAAFPAGTNVRERTAGERDDYTSLAWLAGYTAYKRLNRPADAMGMFVRYANAAKTPQSQSKGQYWAGRAAQSAGQQALATDWLTRASAHYDQFYGQLAAERLGRPIPLPAPAATIVDVPTELQKQFDASELVRAAKWLGQNGRWQDQTQFIRAIAANVRTDTDHLLATRLAKELSRPDLGVMVARAARIDGSDDYVRSGFPEVTLPATLASKWVIVHSIARQESQFDREAISAVGARGLMQLMGPTAQQTAGKLGMPYDPVRLTSDPAYNMTLGSAYFAELLDRFGGNHVLAVAAYNAGAGNVNKFIRANGDPRDPGVDVVDWIEAIPFTETRGYVQHVLGNAVVYGLMNPARTGQANVANQLSNYLGKTSAG